MLCSSMNWGFSGPVVKVASHLGDRTAQRSPLETYQRYDDQRRAVYCHFNNSRQRRDSLPTKRRKLRYWMRFLFLFSSMVIGICYKRGKYVKKNFLVGYEQG